MTHLIVIRGNSAAGKTTLALKVQLALGPGTANIGQDHFRRVVLREHDVLDGDNLVFISSAVRQCLELGYHVVLEGIFQTKHYARMLTDLMGEEGVTSHLYWLELGLDVTVQRHLQKPDIGVPVETIRKWYTPMDLLGVPGEVVVDASGTEDEVLAAVLADLGTIEPKSGVVAERYF